MRAHHRLVVVAVLVLVAIGLASLVGANVLGGQRVAEGGRPGQPHRTLQPGEAPHSQFHRFRLGAIDGERLSPNRDDFAARTSPDGPLLLFLPATRSKPADYQRFLTTALGDGYHVLGLDYWNLGKTLSATCEADARCYGQVQRNRFDGTRSSAYSSVSPAGSIVSRFRDAVAHLDEVDPAGGWGRFVQADEDVLWSDIVVAGHSQGGGEAAYIAHIRPVLGALMFSAPVESVGPVHAAWMDHPGQTPADRMYAIDDVRDHYRPRITGSWTALGLDGTPGDGSVTDPWRTDTAPPLPGADPHAILTDLPVDDPRHAHSRIIKDSTPLDVRGDPQMLPMWQWLLHRFPTPVVPSARS
ncbi:hypothetical protein [Curtobacterium sp. MCBD17_021]|uniref:BPSS1187 family protein n=1 Tax=Curtobacterium sp. MCBD17_021 TaxID=2175665 RepID=UPI000DA9220E|nr:hypothetical protein [Curtobacterium sp. MCBD17_021]PZE67471.1 hypothetical protein DEI83_05280 [Curtobacterium sp. MCBD17_021]